MALSAEEKGLIVIITNNIRKNAISILLTGKKDYIAFQMRDLKQQYINNGQTLSIDLYNKIETLWNTGINTLVPATNIDVVGDASTLLNVEEDYEEDYIIL